LFNCLVGTPLLDSTVAGRRRRRRKEKEGLFKANAVNAEDPSATALSRRRRRRRRRKEKEEGEGGGGWGDKLQVTGREQVTNVGSNARSEPSRDTAVHFCQQRADVDVCCTPPAVIDFEVTYTPLI